MENAFADTFFIQQNILHLHDCLFSLNFKVKHYPEIFVFWEPELFFLGS